MPVFDVGPVNIGPVKLTFLLAYGIAGTWDRYWVNIGKMVHKCNIFREHN